MPLISVSVMEGEEVEEGGHASPADAQLIGLSNALDNLRWGFRKRYETLHCLFLLSASSKVFLFPIGNRAW